MSDHLVKLAEAWVAAGRNHQIERGYGPAAEERAHRDMLAAEFAFRQAAQALADKVKELTFAGEQMMETLKGHQAEISRLQASNAEMRNVINQHIGELSKYDTMRTTLATIYVSEITDWISNLRRASETEKNNG